MTSKPKRSTRQPLADPAAADEHGAELVDEVVALPGLAVSILRPRDSEALLDEDAFENEERMPYWAELWPSSVALARVLARRSLGGRSVLELGCGLGLPSVVAALRGARVLATDWSSDAVDRAARNARRNGVEIETAVLDWSNPGAAAGGRPWDLVLASDVLYERRNVDVLLTLLPALVGGRGEVMVADPGRPPAAAFLAAANEAWRVTTLPVRSGRVLLHRLVPR